ncbi:MAG: SGNH/GDSL hydrolase family protein [Prevotella sp.]|nr:SGNH/GDSL hydrolase family protein [Prevotella sp.]
MALSIKVITFAAILNAHYGICTERTVYLTVKLNQKTLLALITIAVFIGSALLVRHIITVWLPPMQPAHKLPGYEASLRSKTDDSLVVVMIGDSWAAMHHEAGLDSLMEKRLRQATDREVKFVAKGKGGAKSRRVYEFMFSDGLMPYDTAYCTQSLIASRPDYCIIMAGINDAAANVGTSCYLRNYRLIIEHLLNFGIKPVVVQMPNVDLNRLYVDKPLRDRIADKMRAAIAGCEVYDVWQYSKALYDSLQSREEERWMFVTTHEWNPEGVANGRNMYTDDGIHLNHRGYDVLDSCLAVRVAADVKRYRQ